MDDSISTGQHRTAPSDGAAPSGLPLSVPGPQPAAIVLETQSVLHIPGDAVAVDTTLMFDVTDPAAVTIRFESGPDAAIEWLLGRDLLAEGLYAMCGMGDVVVWPGPHNSAETVNLRLSSPTGEAVFELSSLHVRTFLERSFELVPRHRESYVEGIDEELALLLGELG